jgi:arylsulfatase A-like enzyme
MKGRKGSTDEGGVRSPLLIRWPREIDAGLVVPQNGAAIDTDVGRSGRERRCQQETA